MRLDPEFPVAAITRSDLPIINKTNLAPHVGASLRVMERDATQMRGARPFVFADLKARDGVAAIVDHVRALGGLATPEPKVSASAG
ncbi:P-loop NTPase family protein [Sedimentitalea xiamensis]|uniref:hypothetical protein n=1 Tax=Sedimentitalea xiamensis TaxID=3050037 RepID=UPI00389B2B9E